MKKILIFVLTLFITGTCFTQDFSNKGKDFWISYPAHIDGATSVMGIYITSDVDATGTVNVGGVILNFSLKANNVVREFIGPSGSGDAPNTNVYLSTADGIISGAGIHVISDKPVAVYAHIIKSARSAATLVLPTNVWGKNYIVPGYKSEGQQKGYGEITVMAKLPNTTVEIIPKIASLNGLHPAGIPFQIKLANPGDVYQLQFTESADLSGTIVNSVANSSGGCNPIAVISASTWTSLGCSGASGGDNLYQQLFPISTWGKTFLTAPYIDRSFDIVRVFVSDATTIIKKTENGITSILTGLNTAGFYEYSTSSPTQLQADKPISVVHYIVSETCKFGCKTGSVDPACWSDPEMIILSPVEQTINNITVFSAHQNWVPSKQSNVQRCLLNIVIKTNAAASFTINGTVPNASFKVIIGTDFSYLQEDVTATTILNPVQTLRADSAFSAIAYGFGNVESYGYNAGTNVRDLSQQIAIVSQYGIEQTPSSCIGSPIKFKISLPYQPDSLFWNFNGNINQAPAGNVMLTPVVMNLPKLLKADSISTLNGKILYWYNLPDTYSFSAVGTFPIAVTAYNSLSDGCGNTTDIQFDLEISAAPTADFYWLSNGCSTEQVQFRDSTISAKPIYKWRWNFGDSASGVNNTSAIKNPVHLFSAPGTYTVTYSNITTPGCVSNTIIKQIIVTAVPSAKFGISSIVCADKPITFSDSSISYFSSKVVKWFWDYGDGFKDTLINNADLKHSFTPWGNKTVTLKVVTNTGCQSTIFSKSFIVNPKPLASFILPAGICLPADTIKFLNTSNIADGSQNTLNYLWDFGDTVSGKNDSSVFKDPLHYYTSAGPFTINLHTKSFAGCTADTAQTLSTTFAQPSAGISVDAATCLETATNFTSTSLGNGYKITNWFWDFGDGLPISSTQNPSITFATIGIKNSKHWVKTEKGCISDTAIKSLIINPLPIAKFGVAGPFCLSGDINLKDSSTVVSGSITQWKWNLGDSGILKTNGKAFVHNYLSTGNFGVTLTVVTDKGCEDTTNTKTIIIHPLPVAGFIIPEVCLNDSYAQFKDSSSIKEGSITKWVWNLGDPVSGALNTTTVQNPSHKYSATGPYKISLKVTSNNECINTIVQNFFVNGGNPVADFKVNNSSSLCANDSVSIINTSSVVPGSITKVIIFWDMSQPAQFELDDFPLPGKIYKHQYVNFQTPLTKTYTIRFRAYSGGTCVNDNSQKITINAAPSVVFTSIPDICLDANSYLITQAKEQGKVPGTFKFSGDGVTALGLFDPAIAGIGTHQILYTYTSTTGLCIDTASQQIRVLIPPVANFISNAPKCATKNILFTSTATSTAGSINMYIWNFGDGTQQIIKYTPEPFNHLFNFAGNYIVTLQVFTINGCTSSITKQPIIVHPQPEVKFTIPSSVCLPAAYGTFNNLSAISDGTENQFTYLWNFGDDKSGMANNSAVKSPTHLFSTNANYPINLKVTTIDNCTADTTIILNTIHAQPKADFNIGKASICTGEQVMFTDNSNGLDGSVTAWKWSFGDGQTGTMQNISHIYNTDATFTIALFINNSFGCNSDTITKPFIVFPFPVVNAGPDRVVLEGGSIILHPVVSGDNLQFLWTPNSFLNDNSILNPEVISPSNDITYTLNVTAKGGCIASDKVFVQLLKIAKVPNTFTPNGDGINDKWIIKYLESYPGCSIQIFTRTGQLVYQIKGYTDAKAWDGSLNGKALPFDTYYYIIEPGSGRKPTTGYVTLIK